MRLLREITVFASALFLLSSCGSEVKVNNEFIDQLPPKQKAAFIQKINKQCACWDKAIKPSSEKKEVELAKVYATKVGEFASAVDKGDQEKARALHEALTEANQAAEAAQKSSREQNHAVEDCIKKVTESLSAEEKKTIREAEDKLNELIEAKLGQRVEAFDVMGTLINSICPMDAKMTESYDIMIKAIHEYGVAKQKYDNMKVDIEPASKDSTEVIPSE